MAQRRTYLVDRSFQLKLILQLVVWGVVTAALFATLLSRTTSQELSDRQLIVVGATALLSAGALGVLGFIVGHRVAGPLHVVGLQLRALANGQFPRRRSLRRGDELKAFFSQFLDTVDTLREREARHTEMLEGVLARMEAASVRAPELRPAIAALAEEVRARREALAEAGVEAAPADVRHDVVSRPAGTRH